MRQPSLLYEKKLWRRGFKYVAGVDEVGRGSFAGPVVACALVFEPPVGNEFIISEGVIIDDSKKLSPKKREISAKWIKKNSLTYGIGVVSAKVINRLGMAKATNMAFRRAVKKANTRLDKGIEFLLIDAFFIPYVKGLPRGTKKIKSDGRLKSRLARQLAIVNGDEKSLSIAAASIVAKVYRDKLMRKIGERPRYKRYEWFKNKGYATARHRDAILNYGITGYHRKQFVQTYLSNFFSSQSL